MKNKHAQALGKLGAKASPRADAWREMDQEELAAIGRKGAYARWSKLSEDERKAQMEKVRAGRGRNNPKPQKKMPYTVDIDGGIIVEKAELALELRNAILSKPKKGKK